MTDSTRPSSRRFTSLPTPGKRARTRADKKLSDKPKVIPDFSAIEYCNHLTFIMITRKREEEDNLPAAHRMYSCPACDRLTTKCLSEICPMRDQEEEKEDGRHLACWHHLQYHQRQQRHRLLRRAFSEMSPPTPSTQSPPWLAPAATPAASTTAMTSAHPEISCSSASSHVALTSSSHITSSSESKHHLLFSTQTLYGAPPPPPPPHASYYYYSPPPPPSSVFLKSESLARQLIGRSVSVLVVA